MSGFSDIMSYFVKSKEIKVYSMAQYCGLDRSTMYKILNGKRLPGSDEIVQNFSEFMELSPSECQMLWEEYKISRIGKDTYYNRKNITELIFTIENNPELNAESEVYFYTRKIETNAAEQIVALENNQEIKQYLYKMLNVLECPGKHEVRMIVQPTYNFWFDMLQTNCNRNADISMQHILCLNNASDKTGNYSYNFQCLKQMIRMYQSNYMYEPYYYYGQVETMSPNFNIFPGMIIVDGFVICFSEDMGQGIFYYNAKIATLCRNIFDNAKKNARKLGIRVSLDEFTRIRYDAMPNNNKLLVLQSQPDSFYFEDKMSGNEGVQKLFFTKHGFDAKLKKECADKNCQQIVKKIIQMADEKRAFILKGRLEDMPLSFCLAVNEHTGIIAFQDSNKKWVCVSVTEKYFLHVFVDYIESLEEENLAAGKEETIRFLEQYLDVHKM